MKPDKIIIRSEDSEEYTQAINSLTEVINTQLATVGVITEEQYYYGETSSLTHDLERFLEKPSSLCLRKVVIPAGIPSFNNTNNKLRCMKRHKTDSTQHQRFEVTMPLTKAYTEYADFNTDFNASLQSAGSSNFSSGISAHGVLVLTSSDANYDIWVIERNIKFGFLFPYFPVLSSSVGGATCVQLAQTKVIYIETNIETENYVSNASTKISTFIPYTQDVKTLKAGSFSWTNPSDFFYKIQAANYDRIRIRFLDDFMNPMNFNFQPCAIELDVLYPDSTNEGRSEYQAAAARNSYIQPPVDIR